MQRHEVIDEYRSRIESAELDNLADEQIEFGQNSLTVHHGNGTKSEFNTPDRRRRFEFLQQRYTRRS